jgi:hypothetical protein
MHVTFTGTGGTPGYAVPRDSCQSSDSDSAVFLWLLSKILPVILCFDLDW